MAQCLLVRQRQADLFHGVTNATSRLEYLLISGALNESYSDIFGVIVSNQPNRNIGTWNWLVGDGLSRSFEALRDMQDPTRFRQPKHMRDFQRIPVGSDFGGVHTNSGIHNFAAHKVMTSKSAGGDFLFAPDELAAMYYLSLTQQLSPQSTFADSRRGVILAARSLFRALPNNELTARVSAIEAGFDAAGIS
jgi:Zn-dependent metalloprotease